MPQLVWETKSPALLTPAPLALDSRVYPQGRGYPVVTPENYLIWGDNLPVMAALLPQYEGRIELIYADPPFFTNRRYQVRVGHGEDSRQPKKWQLAEGYPDAWKTIDAYLDMLYPRLQLMHRLLSPTGTLYLHLDWHANHYARLLLDEIFGAERILNEIIWLYHGPSPIRRAFNRKHDTILAYTKSPRYTFNTDAIRQPYNDSTVKTFASSSKAGFGKVPDLKRGKVAEDWWYFPVVARLHSERSGYPTQKPAALLERIILASSNPGDLVADFFCGSGTTPLVATRLHRRFIANDSSWRAIQATCTRLVSLPGEPFTIMNGSGQLKNTYFLPSEKFNFTLQNRIIEITPSEGLEYWEVDPAWDGSVFRSAGQAVRQRNSKTVAKRLLLPAHHGDQPLCIRLVTTAGERSQIVLANPPSSEKG